MSGGQYLQPWLGQLIKEAENHPLGSAKNPVRSDMPRGEQAYLRRLRCADGKAPHFAREGNLGEGVYGSIVDAYRVRCVDSSPAESEIIMDMYFPEYQEKQAPPGFTIVSP